MVGSNQGGDDSSKLAKSSVVWYDVEHLGRIPASAPSTGKVPQFVDLTLELKYTSPQFKKIATAFGHALWHKCRDKGFSPTAITTLLQGISNHMKCTYSTYTKNWYLFCQPRKIDPL